MIKTCKKCNSQFTAKRNSRKYCSFACSVITTERENCLVCFKKVKEGRNKFCSTICSNIHRGSHTTETKNKISAAVKTSGKSREYKRGYKLVEYKEYACVICNKKFSNVPSKIRKTCGSQECIKQNQRKNMGGYRKGSGRSKNGYYKGIYCGSTYELVWVMYNLENGIKFDRFSGYIEYGKGRKYYPDFWQNNTIIEIKGYHTETVDIKRKACEDYGFKIKILYKQDLADMFEWFKTSYPDNKLVDMFDLVEPTGIEPA